MKSTIKYLPDEKVAHAMISGEMDTADYVNMLVELHTEAACHGVNRQLVELQGVTSLVNLLDLHDLPEVNKKLPADPPGRRTAIAHSALMTQDLDDLHYYCHRITAEGFNVRLFDNRQAALDWLHGTD